MSKLIALSPLLLPIALAHAQQSVPAHTPIVIEKVEKSLTQEEFDELLPYRKICKAPAGEPISVSMISLIANPEKYEGKRVEVIGYYHSGGSPLHGYHALFLSESDYLQAIISNSIWVELPANAVIEDGYVLMAGIFTQALNGDLAHWNAGICNISYEPWDPKSSVHGP